MALVKRSEKLQPLSAEEYDAVVTQVEANQYKLDEIDTSEVIFSVADEAAMTAKYNSEVAAGRTPIDGKEQIFRQDLNQFWKWNSSLTAKAEFSREELVANTTEKPTLLSENIIVSGKIKEGIDEEISAYNSKLHSIYKSEQIFPNTFYNYSVIQEDGDIYDLNSSWGVYLFNVYAAEKLSIKTEILESDSVRAYAFYTGTVEKNNSTGSSKYISGASFASGARIIDLENVEIPENTEILAVTFDRNLDNPVTVINTTEKQITDESEDVIIGKKIKAFVDENISKKTEEINQLKEDYDNLNFNGVKTVATVADLPTSPVPENGTTLKVGGDSDPSQNGNWYVEDGVWKKSETIVDNFDNSEDIIKEGVSLVLKNNTKNGFVVRTKTNLDSLIAASTSGRYVIDSDIDLDGETITLPTGSELQKTGGKFSNGTIIGNDTKITNTDEQLFGTDVILQGFDNIVGKAEWFGAKNDGVTDDLAPIQKAIDSFKEVELKDATYLVSDKVTLNSSKKIKSNNTIFKVKDAITSDLTVLDIKSNAKIEGSLVINCNRDNTTGKIKGVVLDGDNIEAGVIKVINSNTEGISGDGYGIKADLLHTDNCALGTVLYSHSHNIKEIRCENLNSNTVGIYQHCIDLYNCHDSYFGKLVVKNAHGGTTAPSQWLSGITIRNFNRSEIGSIYLNGMLSTTLKPVGISILSAQDSKFGYTFINGFDGGRHLEILGTSNCIFYGGRFVGEYGYVRGLLTGTSTGITVSNSGVVDFPNRHNTHSFNNTFHPFVMTNMDTGIRDGGYGNTWINPQVYGSSVDGISITQINDNAGTTESVFLTSFDYLNGGSTWISPVTKGNGRNGISVFFGKNIKILNAISLGNGTNNVPDGDASGLGLRSALYIGSDVDANQVDIVGGDFDDDYQLRTVSEGVSTPTVSFENGSFTATFPKGTENIYAGALISLTDAVSLGVPLIARVNDITGLDEVQLTPISHTTGNSAFINASKSGTISGTAGSKTITGVGTAFDTEILGRYWLNSSGQNFQVIEVVSATELTIADPLTATITNASFSYRRFNTQGVNRQLYGVRTSNFQKGTNVKAKNNVTADFTSLFSAGNTESGTATVTPNGSLTVSFTTNFGKTPKVTATMNTSTPSNANVSVSTITRNNFIIYNGTANTVEIHWIAVE